VIPRPGPDQLVALAAEHGFAIAPEEEPEYRALADAVLGVIEQLEDRGDRVPTIEAERDPGRPPAAGEDPYNAVVRWCRVKAREAGLLSGKRIALKDAVAIAGVPLTCGSRALAGFVPAADAVVTERILRAGGEIVAVTNMDDLAFSGGGDSSWYGPTLNPFDPARTAGGSSGGSAAALHYADRVDVAIGCDQGGSIRVPAAWCGVVGLKPTHSLVPYTGIAGIDRTFDHCGPLGRTVADVAALLQAIAGRHESDPRQRGVPERDYVGAVTSAHNDLRGMRIGLVEEGFSAEVGADAAVVEATYGAADRFRELRAEVVPLALPEHVQGGGIAFTGFVEGMYDLLTSGGNGYAWEGRYWSELPAALGPGLREHANELSAQVKTALLVGAHLRRTAFGGLYAKAQNLRAWQREAYDRALATVDCLLLPTTPGLPHPVDAGLPLAERVLRGWAVLANTYPTDITGHPAITLPAAAACGLPVGVMLVGHRFGDDRLLAFAATYERRFGWLPR
jgi:amidase